MVMRTANGQPEVYELFDTQGEPIGRVIMPLDPRVIGRTLGTVLLVRASH
jgi:hypothetical protein